MSTLCGTSMDHERTKSMRGWLDVGEIEFDGNVYTPRQVLADEKLARRAST